MFLLTLLRLARRCSLLLALVVAAGLVGVQTARADDAAAEPVVEEIAGALGFDNSASPGFWEKYAQLVADQRAAAEQRAADAAAQADAERVDAHNKIIQDALKYGRRIEAPTGLAGATLFTEYVPVTPGEIYDVNIRTGEELLSEDGKRTVITKYTKDDLTQLGVVETVTNVIEYVPGSIDLKVGDTRPAPPPGSSAAGMKPHTLDPKADGSLGRASGAVKTEPDAGDPTVVSRHEWDPIPLPNGREITPFEEVVLPGSGDPASGVPFRTGHDITDPAWPGEKARVTVDFDVDGKVAGVVGSVIKDGTETIVAVYELIPGSIGLKPGDTRPAAGSPGGKPTSDPQPSGSSGSTGGGGQSSGRSSGSTGGSGQSPGGTSQDSPSYGAERAKPEAPVGGSGGKAEPANQEGADARKGATNENSSNDDTSEWRLVDQYDHALEDGSKSHTDTYQKGGGNEFKDVRTKTDADGTTSTETTCYSTAGTHDCGSGYTDEPTCQTDCARVAMLGDLYLCMSGGYGGSECGQPPEGARRNATCSAFDHSPKEANPPAEAAGPNEQRQAYDCGEEVNGRMDYGDPADPNGEPPPDISTYADPHTNDGVTDPAEPGEPELVLGAGESISFDMRGTLRDPAGPSGTDEAPSISPPNPGDAEHHA